MGKTYCIKCNKYRKFKNSKHSFVFDKTLVLSIICNKLDSKDSKVFKEEESFKILKFLALINNTSE